MFNDCYCFYCPSVRYLSDNVTQWIVLMKSCHEQQVPCMDINQQAVRPALSGANLGALGVITGGKAT